MVKFQAISEAGNNLYLDNVRVIAAPAVTTEAADNITTSGATLHGTVDANLAGTTVTFEYGTSTLYGTTLSAVPGTVTGHTPTAVSLPIAGLAENTEYHFRVVGVNSCGTVNGSDLTFTTAAGVPLNYTLTGESGPGLVCYNAQQILTVGGTPPNNYTALSGADVTLIAGEKVVFNPDSKVNLGGKLHAYIAPGGPWCNPVKITEVTAVTEVKVPAVESANFTLYPNPTNGNFILVQKGSRTFGSVKVDVYSMSGEKVMTERMIAEKKHEFGFSDIPAGIYFVKVIADDYVETIKLIKTR